MLILSEVYGMVQSWGMGRGSPPSRHPVLPPRREATAALSCPCWRACGIIKAALCFSSLRTCPCDLKNKNVPVGIVQLVPRHLCPSRAAGKGKSYSPKQVRAGNEFGLPKGSSPGKGRAWPPDGASAPKPAVQDRCTGHRARLQGYSLIVEGAMQLGSVS